MTPDQSQNPRCACGWYLTTQEWSEGLNHRAKPGQLVCGGCGQGTDATPEEYAAQLARDKAWTEANP